MIRSTDIEDTYKDGQFLRRWEIVDGLARCTKDAVPVSDQAQADVDAQIAANGLVRQALSDLEVYETALKLQATGEPVRLITEIAEDGTESQVTNPAWQEWEAARQVVEVVSADTLALIEARAGDAP